MLIGIEAHTIEKYERLGAGGNYLAYLLKEWSKLDHKKYQIILYFKKQIPGDPMLEAPVFKKKICRNPLGFDSVSIYYNLLLPYYVSRDKIDVLFLPMYMSPLFCPVKIITAVHDISFRAHKEWFSWRYLIPYLLLGKKAIKKSLALIVCSQSTKKEIMKYYQTPESKIKVVYLAAGENFNNQRDEGKIKEIKEKYNLKNKYFFYAGTIFNRRHLAESIEAFGAIKRKYSEYQFLISGRDFTRPAQNIDKMCQKINNDYPEAIIRKNYIDYSDLPLIYQGADLFVWPSEYEGFGLPVIEAMACGTPVLTTKMTSLAEVADEAAFFVDNPSDVNQIRLKMEQAIEDQKLRNALVEKGLIQASKFSWAKCAEETLKIITDLC